MQVNQNILVIDAGNTSIKLGTFHNGDLQQVERLEPDRQDILHERIALADQAVISSVLSPGYARELKQDHIHLHILDRSTPLPVEVHYATPETLGMDRICNAVAVASQVKLGVSIDVGTCIKFDLVVDGSYKGGSISPGVDLRYRSLNDYTANLPLLNIRTIGPLIGNSTEGSIASGVLNGVQSEINDLIRRYETQYGSDLTFFVTGGDSGIFDFEGKNNIFVDQNLTLKGLYEIFKHNAK